MLRKILIGIGITVAFAVCLMLLMTPTLAHAWNLGPSANEWMKWDIPTRLVFVNGYLIGAATAMERSRVVVIRCPDSGIAWKVPSIDLASAITSSAQELPEWLQKEVQVPNILDELLFLGCAWAMRPPAK